jgi:hypothetical protein
MKIIVKQDTKVWVNGKEITIEKGIRDLEDNLAVILLESANAESVVNEKGVDNGAKEAKR